jgi:site-specific DNA recombinase
MPRKRKIKKASTQYWIGYARKSSDTEDKQIHSIDDQKAMINKHYKELLEEEKKDKKLIILEETRSAFSVGRPIFSQMMKMAEEGKVHGVIVVQPNRISRNHYDSGVFNQNLVDGKIECLDTTLGKRYTKSDTNDIFMLTLEGAMGWKDSADKGARSLASMQSRALEGKVQGPVRLGYRNTCIVENGKIIEKSVEIVKDIEPKILALFKWADTGEFSYDKLALEAEKSGLRGKRGGKLSGSSMEQMIKDPLYKGYYRFMGIVVKAQHEAIVPETLWNHVQLMMKSRNPSAPRPKNMNYSNVQNALMHFRPIRQKVENTSTTSAKIVRRSVVSLSTKKRL